MDYRFGEEDEAFRKEVLDFLKEELPPDWAGVSTDWAGYSGGAGNEEFNRRFQKRLVDRGWLTLAWPKEYGGLGASYIQQYIFSEEMAYHGAPAGGGIGVGWAGPAIMIHGSEDQKRRFLPGIAKGGITVAQGFTEPGAGSDLASVSTRADKDGDDYVINGQKTFTSGAHRSDYIWLLARTNQDAPKHRGLSMFMVPMNTPGVTARPFSDICDVLFFNDVFFDNVRVPKDLLIGVENRGWYQAMTGLDFERSGVSRFAGCRRALKLLVEYAKQTNWNGRPIAEDPLVRDRLAEMALEIEVGRLLALRIVWLQTKGLAFSQESSISKLYGSELAQRLARTGSDIMGPFGTLRGKSKWAPLRGMFEIAYRNSVSATIGAGTSEIQRNIIAQRGLGLPR